MASRLLADENTSHRLVSACQRIVPNFPISHIVNWEDGIWLGLDDTALLMSCAEARLILVAFDRATLAWHAGQLLRAGQDHAGLVLFRGIVRGADYGLPGPIVNNFLASRRECMGVE
jgi:hypothetical protein